MKSKKIIAIAKGVWAFCSYVFVPQWGKNMKVEYGDETFINQEKATE